MISATFIYRLVSTLPLVETIHDEAALAKDFPEYKSQTKQILKTLSLQSDPRCTLESGLFNFHYYIDQGVCYMCISEKMFPKGLAFFYLEEIAKAFFSKYNTEVQIIQRPYAFIEFDTEIQLINKSYKDYRNQQNIDRLNEELRGVTKIMTKNVQDVLQRGEKLEKLTTYSSLLASGAKEYARETKNLNLQLLYDKYGTLLIFFFILLVIYLFWSYY